MNQDKRSLTQRLHDAGYSHCAVSGHGLYRHAVWRTQDGTLVGYMTGSEACDFLHCTDEDRDLLVPHLVGFGPSPWSKP